MPFLQKTGITSIGKVFKWLGGKAIWLVRKEETLIAASFIPIPALDKIILLVRSLDRKDIPGELKMLEALEKVIPILSEYGIEIKEESDLRFVIELVVKIVKKKARVIE